ncbi:MAG: PAS domain-containing protein [Planctomycetota bacterium]
MQQPMLRVLLVTFYKGDLEQLSAVLRECAPNGVTAVGVHSYAEARRRLAATNEFDLCIATSRIAAERAHEALAAPLAARGIRTPLVLVADPELSDVERTQLALAGHALLPRVSVCVSSMRRAIDHALRPEAANDPQLHSALAILGADDGVWDWDLIRDACYYSERWKSLLGYRNGELSESSAEWFRRVHADDVQRLKHALTAHLEGRTAHCECEYRILHRDGAYRWVLTRGSAIYDAVGRVARMAGTQTDITGRRRAEQSSRQTEEQLHHAQKMEAISRFAGGVANDFNNLLAVILGYSDYLLGEVKDSGRITDALAEIKKSAEQATQFSRLLMSFSRQQHQDPRVVDVGAVLRELEPLLQRLNGEKIVVEFAHCDEPALVQVDGGQIEQALMILVINARDAMPKGGLLQLGVRLSSVPEALAARTGIALGRHVLLTVRDTGCGMDQETLTRIFEPFYTTKPTSLNGGLGLPAVYSIVRRSHGAMQVKSRPGRGTLFEIYLPYFEGASVPASARSAPVALNGAPAESHDEILLVEDNDAVRTLVGHILKSMGYRVHVASNDDEAFSLCSAHKSELRLLLTDVVMPGLGGRALADRISAISPGIKVLYMSGYSGDPLVRRGVEEHADFIPKPFTAEDLHRKIRQVLSAAMDPGKAGVPAIPGR